MKIYSFLFSKNHQVYIFCYISSRLQSVDSNKDVLNHIFQLPKLDIILDIIG